MKKHIIPNISKGIGMLIISCGILLASCQGNFDDINTDTDRVKTEDLNKDNLWAAYIQSMQLTVMSEDPNTYQQMDDLHGNVYAGYIGQAQVWNGNRNSTTYYFDIALRWQDMAFKAAYGSIGETDGKPVPGIMNSWNIMRNKIDESSIVYAIGEVVKVAGMHRVTDMYGPIPYIEYGNQLYTPYDSQKDIYFRFFEELDHAIAVMTDYYTANPAARPIASFDLIYGSDIQKWIKFANSLKLRLAMRVKYIDPVNAKKFAEEAVNHKYGVIEDNGGTAKISAGNGIYPFVNPMTQLWKTYNESRMGANMESFLTGYQDPRLEKYFSPASATSEYAGVRSGHPYGIFYKTIAGTPAIDTKDALYWLHAAEVFFLRAEGALEGWSMNGGAGELYNRGIEIAMSEWGITGDRVDDYIKNSTLRPAEYYDPSSFAEYNVVSGSPMLSTITIAWEEGAGTEEKLERIMTQKWLALYPNGQEAWSEFRRTGYPKLFLPAVNYNIGQIPTGQYIKRLPLPTSEYLNNSSLTEEAVSKYLNGNDSPGSRLWWDAK